MPVFPLPLSGSGVGMATVHWVLSPECQVRSPRPLALSAERGALSRATKHCPESVNTAPWAPRTVPGAWGMVPGALALPLKWAQKSVPMQGHRTPGDTTKPRGTDACPVADGYRQGDKPHAPPPVNRRS